MSASYPGVALPREPTGIEPWRPDRVAWVTVSVMPYAGNTRHPSICSSGGTTAPNTPTSSEFSGMGFPATALKTNGMSEM